MSTTNVLRNAFGEGADFGERVEARAVTKIRASANAGEMRGTWEGTVAGAEAGADGSSEADTETGADEGDSARTDARAESGTETGTDAKQIRKIALIPGDGIGPEVMKQAIKVLGRISEKFGRTFKYDEVKMGGCAIDEAGVPLPEETVRVCKASDAVLLGAVGGQKWDTLPGNLRPEAGLLGLRKELNVFANLRPAVVFPQLKSASTLKPEVLGDGLDILVIRELTGGAYFGERGRRELSEEAGDVLTTDRKASGRKDQKAWDTMAYTTEEIERVAHVAFKAARGRNKKLHLIDKANVLESSRLWRETVTEMAKEYPDIQLDYMYVDNAAMQLVRNPRQFCTIVTENLFGDILSDEASMLTGSLGMLPSASLGYGKLGLYEPIHGSAPDIANQDKANPLAMILSTAMMLRYSLDMNAEAEAIEGAVNKVLTDGFRTIDIQGEGTVSVVGCEEMGNLVAAQI